MTPAPDDRPRHACPHVRHVDATVEVDSRQVRVRRDEPEDLLELLRSVRVGLRGHAACASCSRVTLLPLNVRNVTLLQAGSSIRTVSAVTRC